MILATVSLTRVSHCRHRFIPEARSYTAVVLWFPIRNPDLSTPPYCTMLNTEFNWAVRKIWGRD